MSTSSDQDIIFDLIANHTLCGGIPNRIAKQVDLDRKTVIKYLHLLRLPIKRGDRLSPETICSIRKLYDKYDEDVSAVARILGVSRSSVTRYAGPGRGIPGAPPLGDSKIENILALADITDNNASEITRAMNQVGTHVCEHTVIKYLRLHGIEPKRRTGPKTDKNLLIDVSYFPYGQN
ncbi:hypothetical protein ACFL0X_00425 [Nanoarchaeota archaeon]